MFRIDEKLSISIHHFQLLMDLQIIVLIPFGLNFHSQNRT